MLAGRGCRRGCAVGFRNCGCACVGRGGADRAALKLWRTQALAVNACTYFARFDWGFVILRAKQAQPSCPPPRGPLARRLSGSCPHGTNWCDTPREVAAPSAGCVARGPPRMAMWSSGRPGKLVWRAACAASAAGRPSAAVAAWRHCRCSWWPRASRPRSGWCGPAEQKQATWGRVQGSASHAPSLLGQVLHPLSIYKPSYFDSYTPWEE